MAMCAVVAACDWPYENPVDPARCPAGCPPGTRCHDGRCQPPPPADGRVAPDRGPVPCKKDTDCNDHLPCTTQTCKGGLCTHKVTPGNCLVDGKCISENSSNPVSPCQVCDPRVRSDGWTGRTPCVTTLAGSPAPGDNAGHRDGPADKALFRAPTGLENGPLGGVLVTDTDNHCIRHIKDNRVDTYAGVCGQKGSKDGDRLNGALFSSPVGIARIAGTLLVVTERDRTHVRYITASDTVTTVSYAGVKSGWGVGALNLLSTLVVAAPAHHKVYLATSLSNVVPFGTGTPGLTNGDGQKAQFSGPINAAPDHKGKFLVVERDNHDVRWISLSQPYTVGSLAGSGLAGMKDGALNDAQFRGPMGVSVNRQVYEVFVADTGNHAVRRISGSQVSTVAGSGKPGFRDGLGKDALFFGPSDVLVLADGSVVVADTGNHRIRLVTGSW